jgi:virginiamycin B lyase
MPKDLPEGEGKQLVSTRCTVCHTPDRIVVSRLDREHWQHTIAAMRANMHAVNMPDLTDAEVGQALDYLAANFKPTVPVDANSRLPRTLMQSESLKYRVVQYTLVNGYAEPHDVAVDPKGNGWVAERAGKIGHLDPKTLEFAEISPPPGPAKAENQRLGNPQIDPKGMMWFPDGPNGRWLSYDTNTGKFDIYEWPKGAPGAAGGNSLTLHPNGTIWETSGSSVRMLNPATKDWKFFDAPTFVKTKQATGNYGIAVAGDGTVWFAESEVSQMGKIDPATGTVQEFKIPFDGVAFPRRMNTDAAGNVWVGLWNAGRLMKIDYETNKMTLYAPPTKTAGNYSVSVDKKNDLVWVSEQQVDKIARFNPNTGDWVEFPLPESQSDPRRIEVDPHNPNRIWWTGDTSARMGFIEVLSANRDNKSSD